MSIRRACFVAALLGILVVPVQAAAPASGEALGSPPAFDFVTDGFWLNLHHFLYVLGRVQAGMPDVERRAVAQAPGDEERGLARLSPEHRAVWRRALEAAAPLYRRIWWSEHRAANEAWADSMEALLEEHGEAVLDILLRAYGVSWPDEGYTVHLSGYANWAGAYSTYGSLVVISSLDDALRGTLAGLELLFHEAAHQYDSGVFEALVEAAKAEDVRFARGLDHALLFFTVGDAVRRVAPGYVPYAHRYGVWDRRMGIFLPAIEAGWAPYLAGEELGDGAARNEALRAMMRALRQEDEREGSGAERPPS